MKSEKIGTVNFILKITVAYSVIMLIIVIVSLSIAFGYEDSSAVQQEQKNVQTEYVYVVKDDPQETTLENTNEEAVYTVREYMGKIGIFESDGTLSKILDVYVKTLPEADKRLLEEGFEIVGIKELNSIIEDYEG